MMHLHFNRQNDSIPATLTLTIKENLTPILGPACARTLKYSHKSYHTGYKTFCMLNSTETDIDIVHTYGNDPNELKFRV